MMQADRLSAAPPSDAGRGAAPGGEGGDDAVVRGVMEAMAEGRMRLAFQPVRPARRTDLLSFEEGLARVIEPGGRVVAAGAFAAAMERRGLAPLLDRAALDIALSTLARDRRRRISVNLSARTLEDPGWLALLDRWTRRDVDAVRRLIVELTETAAAGDGAAQETRLRIRRAGAAFALDDFGAGRTALAQLPDLRPDIVKIDRSLVEGAAGDPDRRAVLRCIAGLAAHFEALTVAEGVNDDRLAAAVADLGVDAVQGFAFGAPTLADAPADAAPLSGPWRANRASPAFRRAAP